MILLSFDSFFFFFSALEIMRKKKKLMFENLFFREAGVLRTVFLRTVLREEAVLREAALREAALREAALREAALREAALREAALREAVLREEAALKVTREERREEERKNVFVFVLNFLSSISVSLIFLLRDDSFSLEMIEFCRFRLFRSFIFQKVTKIKMRKKLQNSEK
jgi:hypothetical protein